jgi:two-component system, OmpR family, response regulator
MNIRVLVVDDEHYLAITCERLLTRTGWRVTTVGSCDAALDALASDTPALAIVDRQLPDGDGLDVLRAARACGTPVIVVSGHTTAANRQRTLAEGAAGFLGKPFSAGDLLRLVRTVAGDPGRA